MKVPNCLPLLLLLVLSIATPPSLPAQDGEKPRLVKPGELGPVLAPLAPDVPLELGDPIAAPELAVASPPITSTVTTAKPKSQLGLPPLGAVGETDDLRMVVRLRDGTVIMGKPLTVEFPIETPYGTLMVPLASLRSATFGLRIPEEQKKAAEEAIKLLGGSDFKERDKAEGILRGMGQSCLSAVQEALNSGVDLETEKRLAAVLEEVAPEGADDLLLDSLSAGGIRAVGTITIETLEVDCALGKLSISPDKLREIRSLGGTAFAENFESFRDGASEWETQASNNTAWHVMGRRVKEGKRAMWCGVKGSNQYSDNAMAVLTSPAIDLSKLDSPVLRFSYWLQMEDGADSLMMEFSKDGGNNWEGTNQFSSNGSWSQQRVDLSDFRSHNFRFRFRFQSDGSSVEQGAFLDEFTIGEMDELE